jgi:hypothetical protein
VKSLKYCTNCGTALGASNPKFCSECGEKLGSEQGSKKKPLSVAQNSSLLEEEAGPVKLNTYKLGVDLENTTASILEKMGYSVEKRKRLPTKSGATAEIDILLTRGNRRRIVECKNYDPSRSVPVSDMRIFKDKLSDTGILSGLFVTNTVFSGDAEKLAESFGIELWDGDEHKEKFYAYSIGRIRNPSLINEPILPLVMDFTSASTLNLKNSEAVRLFSSVLLYHPYIIVKYRLQAKRSDPTGRSHIFSDSGIYYVDALDGDIINIEKNIIQNVLGVLKSKEERVSSKEDKFVCEDLETIVPISKPVLLDSDYTVSPAEPEVTEEEAIKIVKYHLVEKNKQQVSYQIKKRGEIETCYFSFVPRFNEISIRGVKLVYVPKWSLEYEAGDFSFSRRLLASSGRTIEDDLAKCHKCTLLRRETIAVCERCGIPICEKHLYQEGALLCEDHISENLKQEIKSKSVFSTLKRKLF